MRIFTHDQLIGIFNVMDRYTGFYEMHVISIPPMVI